MSAQSKGSEVDRGSRCWPAIQWRRRHRQLSQVVGRSVACAFRMKKKCQVITSCYCVTSDFPHCGAEKKRASGRPRGSLPQLQTSSRNDTPGFPASSTWVPSSGDLVGEVDCAGHRGRAQERHFPPNCSRLLPSRDASGGASVNMAFCVCVRGQQKWVFMAGKKGTSMTAAGQAVFRLQTMVHYHLPNKDKLFLDSQQAQGYT